MDAEFFVWFENNEKDLTNKFDEIYKVGREFEPLEDYRIWEEFVHSAYVESLFESKYKAEELSESTIKQLEELDWEGEYGTAGL